MTDAAAGSSTVVIGRIRKPHGVDGAVKVESYSGEADHFKALDTVELIREGRTREMEIESVAVHNRVPVVRFRGVETPESARLLSGWEIQVERNRAARLGNNEFYAADLVGASVTVSGEPVGRVLSVIEGAQAPLLEIDVLNGGPPVLVPFMERFVGDVDTGSGHIEIYERWILDTG